ncbi:hypothetical protein [Peredibacter starrii]|uniref:PilZ domain-containing protein n=1 Tax=Peredibacter starrii TaxID=28202 RepID=A0AAX4HKT3_9BACT|nr:hypothetical protein [Peredibacter starrii]WPU63846.1 hypothetical protein SOO65_14215 [Peredibacter starrii]
MLNLDSYRSSTDYREILRILQKASSLQDNFIWQSHAIGKSIIPIHHFEIDFVTREVVIYFDTQKYMMDNELPLYVKLDYHTSVFKVTDYRVGLDAVYFTFPALIKTMELRGTPRHSFQPNQDRAVSLKPTLTGMNRESSHELQVRVMDVSEAGLGLIVSEHNRSFLKNNRILWVTRLQDIQLQHPILAEVVYINNEVDAKFQIRKQKEMKVGIKLSGSIPPEIYHKFIQ